MAKLTFYGMMISLDGYINDAKSAPIPLEAPVTNARFSLRSIMCLALSTIVGSGAQAFA